MIKEITHLNKKSLAKIAALFYGLIGFIMALAIAISTMVNIILQKDFQGSAILVTLFNLGAGLLLGVLIAVLTALWGWLVGYVMALLYNWFVKKVGGIKIELKDEIQTEQKEEMHEEESQKEVTAEAQSEKSEAATVNHNS